MARVCERLLGRRRGGRRGEEVGGGEARVEVTKMELDAGVRESSECEEHSSQTKFDMLRDGNG